MTQSDPAEGYAGDLESRAAHALLEREPEALLLDVRSAPEWEYVGRPDPAALGGRVAFVSWKTWPGMLPNQRFLEAVAEAGVGTGRPLLLLCRSGQRSREAAIALTAAGYGPCWNVSDGFEGPKDAEGHRNSLAGWRAAGLPWVQG
ncbi:MAG: rhodanese-like domain-containing protein [Tistlia sp.]|uniref:rhodanese-like domain-containing protein n=1 Tax=Tistlia sp. TaxID=3057121 RepID=UPI0034A2C09C